MKKEFMKARDILDKIKENDDNINSVEIKTPELKELAWIGHGGAIFAAQLFLLMISMVISLITSFLWQPSLEAFVMSAFIIYGFIMIPYTIYVRLTYNVSKIKGQSKEPLYEEYHKALEAIDMDYLDYDKFTREEVLILMDKAELSGREGTASSSSSISLVSSNSTFAATTTAMAVTSTIVN